MNKKGIEGLPLKYVVIVLVAIIVISIVLEMLDILKFGILHAVLNINTTLSNATAF